MGGHLWAARQHKAAADFLGPSVLGESYVRTTASTHFGSPVTSHEVHFKVHFGVKKVRYWLPPREHTGAVRERTIINSQSPSHDTPIYVAENRSIMQNKCKKMQDKSCS